MSRAISNLLLCTMLGILVVACNQTETKKATTEDTSANWQYFGLRHPDAVPEIFSPDIISTPRNERDFSISPEGSIMFYSLVLPANNLSVILDLHFDGYFWTKPEIARFSGKYSDLEPCYTPDGNKIFFASVRPTGSNPNKEDFDIWYIEKRAKGWSEPINPGSPVNSDKNEYYPSVALNGSLYFTAAADDSFGKEDIYRCEYKDGIYLPPVNLGDSVNSEQYEFNAFIAPDESYLLYSSAGRSDGFGGGDLYISYKKNDGTWTHGHNLGKPINSDRLDFCPFVSHDGKFLFFTSQRENKAITNREQKKLSTLLQLADGIDNGLGNIYWVAFDKDKWQK